MKLNMVWIRFSTYVALITCAAFAEAASLAFVGFNADGTDGYSLATFEPISTGTEINFTDDEWNGTAFVDSNEADWKWTATSDVAAGTVINFANMTNIYSGVPSATSSLGTIEGVTVGSNNPGYANGGEVIYAFTGTRLAPHFLAAISSDSAVNFSFGGLTGAHAIQLPVSSDGCDSPGLSDSGGSRNNGSRRRSDRWTYKRSNSGRRTAMSLSEMRCVW